MMEHDAHSDTMTATPTLGEQLQDARKKKNLSIADVAAQLRINKEIVTYLETQQWDKMPGRTYARGYFANYVRFLGLPHDEMLALFNLEYTAVESTPDLKQYGLSDIKSKSFPWLNLFILIALAIISWFAYQQWKQVEDGKSLLPAINEQPAIDNVTDDMGETNEALINVDEAGETMALEAEAEMYPVESNEEVVEADVETVPDESLPVVTDVSELPAEPETEVVEQISNHIQIDFSDKCWVEIRDSKSKILVSKIMESGQSLVLDSELPLNVLLGQASAATVQFNEKEVDLTPFIQGDVARLTLGVES